MLSDVCVCVCVCVCACLQVWLSLDHGAASMSSIVLSCLCCQWLHSRLPLCLPARKNARSSLSSLMVTLWTWTQSLASSWLWWAGLLLGPILSPQWASANGETDISYTSLHLSKNRSGYHRTDHLKVTRSRERHWLQFYIQRTGTTMFNQINTSTGQGKVWEIHRSALDLSWKFIGCGFLFNRFIIS